MFIQISKQLCASPSPRSKVRPFGSWCRCLCLTVPLCPGPSPSPNIEKHVGAIIKNSTAGDPGPVFIIHFIPLTPCRHSFNWRIG